MRIIEPVRPAQKKPPRPISPWLKRLSIGVMVLLVVLSAGGVYLFEKPQPKILPNLKNLAVTSQTLDIPWPSIGQAAVGASGYGVLAQHSDEQARPMASVNKVLTALMILNAKPISTGQQGPTITMTAADVARYNDYLSKGGSVVKVAAGEQLTEYQALQAMLLPSANNMADSLVIWAYGSIEAYITAANNYALQLGMTKTKVVDAGGLSVSTVSTPTDLVRLGEAAVKNSILAEIVAQPSATLPVQGLVNNLNGLLGTDDITGIKTGHTDEAGGCFLGSAKLKTPAGGSITVLVAVMAASDLEAALKSAQKLIVAAKSGFGTVSLIASGTEVGYYNAPWRSEIRAIVEHEVIVYGWRPAVRKATISLDTLRAPVAAGTKVGKIKITGDKQTTEVDVVLHDALPKPTRVWRLRHLIDSGTIL